MSEGKTFELEIPIADDRLAVSFEMIENEELGRWLTGNMVHVWKKWSSSMDDKDRNILNNLGNMARVLGENNKSKDKEQRSQGSFDAASKVIAIVDKLSEIEQQLALRAINQRQAKRIETLEQKLKEKEQA